MGWVEIFAGAWAVSPGLRNTRDTFVTPIPYDERDEFLRYDLASANAQHRLRSGVCMNGRSLLVVCSNPPTTSGARTRGRVQLAAELLETKKFVIGNLCHASTYRSGDLAKAGDSAAPWNEARLALAGALVDATDVLLAYGVVEPAGLARAHHRAQVKWLMDAIPQTGLKLWTVGGTPRHPSRWQRFTWKHYPDLAFREALKLSLMPGVPL